MNEAIDTIVIGAGIVGVSTALHLQFKGQRVLLLDKRGAGQETSYGNSGILENSYVMPFTPPSWKKIPDILLGRLPAARMGYPSGLTLLPWMLDLYLKSQTTPRRKNGMLLRPLLFACCVTFCCGLACFLRRRRSSQSRRFRHYSNCPYCYFNLIKGNFIRRIIIVQAKTEYGRI